MDVEDAICGSCGWGRAGTKSEAAAGEEREEVVVAKERTGIVVVFFFFFLSGRDCGCCPKLSEESLLAGPREYYFGP